MSERYYLFRRTSWIQARLEWLIISSYENTKQPDLVVSELACVESVSTGVNDRTLVRHLRSKKVLLESASFVRLKRQVMPFKWYWTSSFGTRQTPRDSYPHTLRMLFEANALMAKHHDALLLHCLDHSKSAEKSGPQPSSSWYFAFQRKPMPASRSRSDACSREWRRYCTTLELLQWLVPACYSQSPSKQ